MIEFEHQQTQKRQRLFFALWPSDDLREKIKHVATKVNKISGGKPVPIEKQHVTVRFLGSVNARTRQCVEQVAGSINSQPFTMQLDQLGHWPRPRVLWLGAAQTPEPLHNLVKDLNTGLRECGLQPEARPFHVHMTLMRKVKKAPQFPDIDSIEWAVDSFVLVESQTLPEGAVYTVLKSWPL